MKAARVLVERCNPAVGALRVMLAVQWDQFLDALAGGRGGIAALSIARAIQRSGIEHTAIVPTYREVTAR